MGYGIINMGGFTYGLDVPHHSSQGEIKTGTHDVSGLGSTDINIQCAMNGYSIYESGIDDYANIGIARFVDNGNVVDFADKDWVGMAFSYTINSYRIKYRISANGGWMRGCQTLYYWGDTEADYKRTAMFEHTVADLVYDDAGAVRHIHHISDLSGPVKPELELELGSAIDAARAMGHEGSLEVMRVTPDQVKPGIRVDLSQGTLVSDLLE
jgi:hypothetical protein